MNKEIFKKAKEKYESVQAPSSLSKKVENVFRKDKQKNIHIITLGVIASAFACFVIVLNTNPVFANNISSNKFIKNIVNVLTASKYEVKDRNMKATIITPKITGIEDSYVEEKLNEKIQKKMGALIDEFEKTANSIKADYPEAHYGIDAGYIVRTNNEKYLSVDVYAVNTVGSSSTIHEFYNIDKTSGKEIKLKDLICEENYLEKLAKTIMDEIERINMERKEKVYFATYEDIYELLSEKEEFYINESGNPVIVFNKYEIGIGAEGCPEFEICEYEEK